jgi:predicted kinase
VVLDATHIRRAHRDAARELARTVGVQSLAVEVVADETSVRARLESRRTEGLSPSDASWDVYKQQLSAYEPLTHDEGPTLRIEGGSRAAESVSLIVKALGL